MNDYEKECMRELQDLSSRDEQFNHRDFKRFCVLWEMKCELEDKGVL